MDLIVKADGARRTVTMADGVANEGCRLTNTTDGIVKMEVGTVKREIKTFYLMPNESRVVPVSDLEITGAEAESAVFGMF